MSLEIGDSITPSFTLRETSPLIYDWNTSEAQIYAAAPRTNLPSAFVLPAPGSPVISEEIYVTTQGDGVKARATLIWQASPSPYVASYEIIARYQGGPWQFLGETPDTTFQQDDILPGAWEWGVRGKTRLGVVSTYATTTREIFGLAAPPVALSGVTLQTAGGLAVLKWALHPDIDVRIGGQIVIRHSAATVPAWDNGRTLDAVAGGTQLAVVPLLPGAYLLRALDASGALGPASVVTTDGAQVIAFAPVTSLTEDPGFSGAKTDTVASGGLLTIGAGGLIDDWADFDAVPDFDFEGGIKPEGTYTFSAGMDLTTVRRVRLRSYVETGLNATGDLIDDRQMPIDDWLSFDGADGGEVDVVVEFRSTDDNPGGSPVWSEWSRLDATEVNRRAFQFRARLTTANANYTPAVSALRVFADEVA